MPKQLQLILGDQDYCEIERIASARGVSIDQWVREALMDACHRQSDAAVEKKLAAIRRAALHEFPTSDIDTMLREIEKGIPSTRFRVRHP